MYLPLYFAATLQSSTSSRLHFLAHQLAHLFELLRRRRFIIKADDILPNRGRADEGGDVARYAVGFEKLEILSQGIPFNVVLNVLLLLEHPLLRLVIERPHRFAFAHDLRRHTLANLTLRAAILDKRFVRPGKHVDEAGRDGEPACVDYIFGARLL